MIIKANGRPGPAALISASVFSAKARASSSKLLLKRDFEAFAKFTYPKLIEMIGGEKKMVDILKNGEKEMDKGGIKFLNVTIGEPSSIITKGNELQCTIPQTIEMKVPNGKLITKSTLIGISTDGGKHWYFVDTSGKSIQALQKMLPNLSSDLIIPAQGEPVLYKD